MTTKLTLDALEVLDAIDRKGSFAAAAAALYRAPSTITYTVQKLEDDLGIVLFRREGRRSIITPAGQEVVEQGRLLLEAANRLVETAQQLEKGWESRLRITIDSIFDAKIVYPIIEEFYKLNTGVEIELLEEVMEGSWESIIRDKTDILLGAHPPQTNTTGLRFEKLMTAQWLFVVASHHPLAKATHSLSPEDIENYHGIIIKDSSSSLPPQSRLVIDKQIKLRVVTMEQKLKALLSGLGVGHLPHHRVKEYLDRGELVAPPIDYTTERTPLHLVWRTNNKGKAMRWFLEKFREIDFDTYG